MLDPFVVVERIGAAHVLAGPTPWHPRFVDAGFEAGRTELPIAAVELEGDRCFAEIWTSGSACSREDLLAEKFVAECLGMRVARVLFVDDQPGRTVMAREIIPGVSLPAFLRASSGGQHPVVVALWIVREIAHALAPANAVVGGRGDQFVIDWDGRVRLQPNADWSRDRFAWLTPETIRGFPNHAASGTHVVAHALYALLEQRHPWADMTSDFLTLESVRFKEPLPLRRRDIPDVVRHLIERGLRKNPNDRFLIAETADFLDEAVAALGGDPASFVRSFLAARCAEERKTQLDFIEQLQLAEL